MDTVYGKAAAKAKCSPSSSAENSLVNVSQAIPASSSGIVSIPQPSEALFGNSPPPFLSKTYDMVDDPNTDDIVSWSSANNSFIVWNPPELGESILPNYFKHNNFSSFVRQLNTYGFRKVDPDRCEFAAEGFLRGKKHLLNTMHRRRRPVSQNKMQAEKFEDLEEEVEQLKRDKNVLMHELIEMRQQQQSAHQTLKTLDHRLAATEQRQQQMMAFLAKTMQNPFIFANLVHQNDANKRIDSLRRRRELPRQEQLTQRVAASESCIPKHQGALMDPAQASFTDFNNPQSASVDRTCNLLKEPFHGIEPEIRGESATSTSDSHPNINLSASFTSAETKQVSRDGEGFTLAQSSGGESHMVVAPDVASASTQQYLEGAEVLEMDSASDERQMSTVALPPILDDTLEGDWTEIFESESIQQI